MTENATLNKTHCDNSRCGNLGVLDGVEEKRVLQLSQDHIKPQSFNVQQSAVAKETDAALWLASEKTGANDSDSDFRTASVHAPVEHSCGECRVHLRGIQQSGLVLYRCLCREPQLPTQRVERQLEARCEVRAHPPPIPFQGPRQGPNATCQCWDNNRNITASNNSNIQRHGLPVAADASERRSPRSGHRGQCQFRQCVPQEIPCFLQQHPRDGIPLVCRQPQVGIRSLHQTATVIRHDSRSINVIGR